MISICKILKDPTPPSPKWTYQGASPLQDTFSLCRLHGTAAGVTGVSCEGRTTFRVSAPRLGSVLVCELRPVPSTAWVWQPVPSAELGHGVTALGQCAVGGGEKSASQDRMQETGPCAARPGMTLSPGVPPPLCGPLSAVRPLLGAACRHRPWEGLRVSQVRLTQLPDFTMGVASKIGASLCFLVSTCGP